MKKQILTKSPLVMVLIELRFTELPEDTIDNGLKKFKELLFKLELSDSHKSEIQQFDVVASNNTQPAIKQFSAFRWDFRNIARTQRVTFLPDMLVLQSTEYTVFEELYALWESVISAFHTAFPDAQHAGMRRLGLRYMDAFIPDNSDCLHDYIDDNWLSPQQKNNDESTLHNHRQITNTKYGVLRLDIEERMPIDGRIHVLPRDIADPSSEISLSIAGQQHWETLRDKKYAIVDIDHAWEAQNALEPLKDQIINSKLQSLHKANTQVFWELLTSHAKNKWGMEAQE